MNIIPMNYNQAYENALLALKAGLVPYVTSQPGLGKSAMAQQLANNFNLELIDLRLSMLESSDISGLPNFTANGTAYFAPFDIFPLETTPLPEGKAGWFLFCHHADTEVLTKDSGFVKFSELSKDALVAQYDMTTHAISYAKPEAYIEYHKKGRLVVNEGNSVKYAITEDHDLVIQTKLRPNRPGNQLTYKRKPLETSISGDLQMPLAGYNEQGWKDALTYDDKLAIAFQADGSFTWEHVDGESCSISFGFNKVRKIEQFRKDFPQAKEVVYGDMTNFYLHKIPKHNLSKRLRDVFKPSDFTVEGCKAFLEYVKLWDGFTSGSGYGYGSVILDNASVVQEFAILSGQKCNISTQVDNRKDTFSDYHKCHWYPRDACTTQALYSQTVEDYDGMVYCLKMPKGTLVTRYKGSVLISGNCDELNAASRSTLAAAYGLILERRVGNRKLHPNVAIMAAGNRESDGAITTKIGTAMQSRLVHIELSVSHTDWLENVAVPKGYSSEIIAFLGQFPDKLNNFNPKHEEQTFACPRSWSFTDKILKAHNKPVTQTLLPLLAGTIGMSTALSFVQFATSLSDMPTWDDVLNGTAKVPSNLNSRWATVTMLFENWSAVHADKIIAYADNFSLDLRIFLFRMILKKHPNDTHLASMRKMMVELSRYLS